MIVAEVGARRNLCKVRMGKFGSGGSRGDVSDIYM